MEQQGVRETVNSVQLVWYRIRFGLHDFSNPSVGSKSLGSIDSVMIKNSSLVNTDSTNLEDDMVTKSIGFHAIKGINSKNKEIISAPSSNLGLMSSSSKLGNMEESGKVQRTSTVAESSKELPDVQTVKGVENQIENSELEQIMAEDSIDYEGVRHQEETTDTVNFLVSKDAYEGVGPGFQVPMVKTGLGKDIKSFSVDENQPHIIPSSTVIPNEHVRFLELDWNGKKHERVDMQTTSFTTILGEYLLTFSKSGSILRECNLYTSSSANLTFNLSDIVKVLQYICVGQYHTIAVHIRPKDCQQTNRILDSEIHENNILFLGYKPTFHLLAHYVEQFILDHFSSIDNSLQAKRTSITEGSQIIPSWSNSYRQEQVKTSNQEDLFEELLRFLFSSSESGSDRSHTSIFSHLGFDE
ncbi:hypothetical protein L1887_01278 [Cichorium endivia]|nr:hypothetical protein L1887_01278 [Cichorium endivia]